MKKVLTLLLAFVLVIGATIAGTLAYLTANDEVTNTFTVGKVAITLDEADVDADGQEIADADRVKANEYKLWPGKIYDKDPTVHLSEGSEPCYIRMIVTIENWKTLEDKLPVDKKLPENLLYGTWNNTFWPCKDYTVDKNGTARLEFRHGEVLNKNSNIPALFTKVQLPSEVKDLTGLDNVVITITAEAIQAEGFTTAEEAFTALDQQKNPSTT